MKELKGTRGRGVSKKKKKETKKERKENRLFLQLLVMDLETEGGCRVFNGRGKGGGFRVREPC